jgi:hypothetical protein
MPEPGRASDAAPACVLRAATPALVAILLGLALAKIVTGPATGAAYAAWVSDSIAVAEVCAAGALASSRRRLNALGAAAAILLAVLAIGVAFADPRPSGCLGRIRTTPPADTAALAACVAILAGVSLRGQLRMRSIRTEPRVKPTSARDTLRSR